MLVCRDCAQSLGWAVDYCPFCGEAQAVAVVEALRPTPAQEAVPVQAQAEAARAPQLDVEANGFLA